MSKTKGIAEAGQLRGFPRELLDKSKAEREEYFQRFTVRHPHLDGAYVALVGAITESQPGSIILVSGPAGVGKTTLLERVEKHLIEESLGELEDDRGRIPAALIEVVAPDTGNFSWLDYYERFLKLLNEPLINRKIETRPAAPEEHRRHPVGRARTGRALRVAVEEALRHRRLSAVLMDEAQHLATISSGRKLFDQLNAIKSLANMTGTTHVLAGVYDLLRFRNLSGQLSRRSIDVHFRRYNAELPEERQAFINVLYTFQHHLPLAETPDLVADWDYFYERTIGCVGILKSWLLMALIEALKTGKKGLPHKIIEQRALPVSQCNTLLAEAVEGERALRDNEEARAALRTRMGLTAKAAKTSQPPEAAHPQGEQTPGPPPQKNRRVGTRKPVRDSIGGG
jgi:DNA polymerase III delta prime subunit